MLGNSSSGLIEAPSFELPVVNVGSRQQGRHRGRNVIDSGNTREEIIQGLRLAMSDEFRASVAGMTNPFGDGQAARRIVRRLCEVELNDQLLRKEFHEPVRTRAA
jgi:UDP-N-acetylglucosamine 2-epimerase (non-hydrolysing)/GDP/UDP-N,N'-diacetylbacillosamine 2-epimerase (hydrolysing)